MKNSKMAAKPSVKVLAEKEKTPVETAVEEQKQQTIEQKRAALIAEEEQEDQRQMARCKQLIAEACRETGCVLGAEYVFNSITGQPKILIMPFRIKG